MFDSSADLVVLPCSTNGTVSDQVLAEARRSGVGKPRQRSVFGDVLLASSGQRRGRRYAWATSVESNRSEQSGIRLIGSKLAEITRKNHDVRSIAVPLLGAGAGGLTIEEAAAALRDGFAPNAAPDARMTIYALDSQTFQILGASFSPPSVPRLPEDLVQAYASGQCAVFVGSGLSAPAGLPMWPELVRRLLRWATAEGVVDDPYGRSLLEALDAGETNLVADAIVSRSNVERLSRFLDAEFGGKQPTPAYAKLAQMPFAAALTTNFDDLLEKSYWTAGEELPIFTPADGEGVLDSLSQSRRFILKLYGTPRLPEGLLVSPAQYREAVSRNPYFGRSMSALLSSRTILFLGASLEGIDAYLSGIGLQGNPDETPRRHYAVVAVKGSAWTVRADMLTRRYNISVIPIQLSSSESYSELLEFLRQLEIQTPFDGISSEGASRLRKVELTNIGPFASLELELDPETTVIVGDNGVGKSSILRAVAAAFAGEDSAPFVGRLVSSATKSGSVTLTTDADRRLTSQIFLGDLGPVVVSHPSRPMDGQDSLVVGFPAVRVFTWQAVSDPKPPFTRPTPADLLPLLAAEPDTRLDRVKEWIFSQEKRQRRGGEASLSTREFFDVLKKITPGLNLRFEGIDRETSSVRISSGGEAIPIESVSQGTAALVGWIGVVLQRLYELGQQDSSNGAGSSLFGRPLLVLIDEIDAHMHPRWQQLVLRVFRETFPQAQIVATTHSPLIVSGLKPGQVVVLSRAEEDHEVEDPRTGHIRTVSRGEIYSWYPNEDYSLMRADQILTSPTFGLRSTIQDRTDIDRYTELLCRFNPSTEEEREMAELRRKMAVSLSVGETPEERSTELSMREAAAAFLSERARDIGNEAWFQSGSVVPLASPLGAMDVDRTPDLEFPLSEGGDLSSGGGE